MSRGHTVHHNGRGIYRGDTEYGAGGKRGEGRLGRCGEGRGGLGRETEDPGGEDQRRRHRVGLSLFDCTVSI